MKKLKDRTRRLNRIPLRREVIAHLTSRQLGIVLGGTSDGDDHSFAGSCEHDSCSCPL